MDPWRQVCAREVFQSAQQSKLVEEAGWETVRIARGSFRSHIDVGYNALNGQREPWYKA